MILRYATFDDCEYLLALRNDPVTRMMSRNDKPITVGKHYAWFSTTGDTVLIAEIEQDDDENTPVGSLRFIHHPHEIEVSIVVDPKHRGNGYAVEMLKLGMGWFGSTDKHIVAYVRRDNEPSLRAFRRAGFKESDPYVRFEWGG